MASSSMQPGTTENKPILTPVRTLEGHQSWKYSLQDSDEFSHISCISYFPDGKQMISRSRDKTIRRWDLREGKEIEEAREVCGNGIDAVGGRWVVSAGYTLGLKVSEVETGIVRTFYIGSIRYIDISTDSALVAGGSYDGTARIWSLDTGKLVAGPFKTGDGPITSVRLSEDSRKLAVSSNWRQNLQVWDVQAQKLLVRKSTPTKPWSELPVFWTTKDKSIVAASSFTDDFMVTTIYEFDASTLEIVGAPFEHTDDIRSLALSSDCVLLAISSAYTIGLWAFEFRQLLASFDVSGFPRTLVFSPASRQLAYTTLGDAKIYICNIPANILASIELKEPQPNVCIPHIHPSFIC
ncbi:uncharacterized protein F5891DRAFT_746997 [Suillus fuscotomentosus]|uniref:WD40 repeat-like protein n=1 Tax=Suillus fuscotomentosus TaxID=1912939 RepID=A0AAD4EE63_9AGAM|nr:uncharacterized protein F5891DRAFT_746997 [Suillus fuscotomentosus]KAG1904521.1 hypothetical protein F5891DRAFT_746997 [Suillus fuscotomentosus]